MAILTGGGMEQGDAKFEFGASLAEAGEKGPVDYQHTTYLLPLLCVWNITHLFEDRVNRTA